MFALVRRWVVAPGMAVVAIALAFGATAAEPQQKPAAAAKFIGAAKCKNCHNAAETGEQHAKWKAEKHAKAFAALASPKAKEIATAKGIADPQKAAECLKCHVTAAGEPPDRLMKGFDFTEGVQCESCHGPAEKHLKARMAAAASAGDDEGAGPQARAEIPKGELGPRPDAALCTTCHNTESPTYKPFCFKHRIAEIDHFDPRNAARKAERDAELAKLPCECDSKK